MRMLPKASAQVTPDLVKDRIRLGFAGAFFLDCVSAGVLDRDLLALFCCACSKSHPSIWHMVNRGATQAP